MSKIDLNHQSIRVPGAQISGNPTSRLCRLCGAYFDEGIHGVCPSRVVRFAAPRLFEDEEESDWTTLGELRKGAIFETRDGIRAVKSEYHYDHGPCQCVLLDSGEYAHFPDKNDTEVREISVE